MSHLIRIIPRLDIKGSNREEGISLMKKYEGEFPKRYFQEFLEYLFITQVHFWDVVNAWRLKHLWEKKENMWEFKHPIK
jgi:hypothetical protein